MPELVLGIILIFIIDHRFGQTDRLYNWFVPMGYSTAKWTNTKHLNINYFIKCIFCDSQYAKVYLFKNQIAIEVNSYCKKRYGIHNGQLLFCQITRVAKKYLTQVTNILS